MQTGDDILFTAPGPDPIPTATTEIVGTPGNSLNVYWIVSHFPIGSVVSGPFPQKSSPNLLDDENYVLISWLPTPGASSYDLLFTRELKLPRQPGRFLLAANLTQTSFRDQGDVLQEYDLAGVPLGAPQEEHIYFNNRDFKQPTVQFIPWPIQVSSIIFEDGSSQNTAGGGGLPAPPNQSVQFNNNQAFGGSENLTWINSDSLLRIGDVGGYHVDITPQYFGPPTGFPTIGLFYGTDPDFSFVGGMVFDSAGFDGGLSIKAQASLRITNQGGLGGRPIIIDSMSSLSISSFLEISIGTGGGPFAPISIGAGQSHLFLQQFGSGNVGIGTFPFTAPNFGNPLAKLDVHKTTQDAPSLTPGSPAHFILGVDNFLIELAMGIDPNYNCWIQSRNANAPSGLINSLVLNPLGGNVGINTQNPQAALSVSAFGSVTIPVVRVETTGAGGFCYISLENPTLYYPSGVKFLSQGNFMGEINQDGYGNIQIIAAGSNPIQFYTEATEAGGTVHGALGTLRMQINSQGRVDITGSLYINGVQVIP